MVDGGVFINRFIKNNWCVMYDIVSYERRAVTEHCLNYKLCRTTKEKRHISIKIFIHNINLFNILVCIHQTYTRRPSIII